MIHIRRQIPLVYLMTVILFVSCSKNPQLLYISYERPDNLIPIMDMNEEGKYISELIFDGLVNKSDISADGREQYKWALVSEGGYVEESPDNRFLISIYLKKGIKWHHGKELTSKDILYTWNAIQQSNSPLKGWLNSFVEDISLFDDDNYKFKIQLKVERSKEAFMELFAPVKILPHEYLSEGSYAEMPVNLNDNSKIANAFKWRPVGTGPYSIDARESEFISLKSFPEYIASGVASIPEIRAVVEKDRLMAVKTFNNTKHSILFNVNPESFEAIDKANSEYSSYIPYSFYIIAYNTQKPPFNNISFRKAVNSLTNKEELAKSFIGALSLNSEKCVNHSIFPSNSRYYLNSPAVYSESTPFSLSTAKSYISSSGFNGGTFNILVSSVIDGENRIRSFTDLYSQEMQKAGVKVEVNDVTSPVYYEKIRNRDFDAVLIQLTGFDHFFDIRGLFKADSEKNFWGISDSRLNLLLEKFGTTIALDKLMQITSDIHTRIEELSPGCFLFTVPRKCYYSKDITGVYVHPEVGFSTIENWSYKNN